MTLPKGLYDRLITPELRDSLAKLPFGAPIVKSLSGNERRLRLLADLSQRIADVLEAAEARDDYTQIELATLNQILAQLHANPACWQEPVQALLGIGTTGTAYPATGLHNPWLFAAGRTDTSLLGELRAELSAADQVDIIVSFITWSGVRRLIDLFTSATATDATGTQRTRFRILTTTYTGATEERALTWLANLPGVTVKVSLDGRRSRLHAKAWLFRRATDFGSAYVGSANLSGAALTGGLEWTIKVTQAGQRDVFEKAIAHFETLWADPEFQTYDPNNSDHVQQLRVALRREKSGPQADDFVPLANSTWFDIEPKPFQQSILDRIGHERDHGRRRNLLVAATGTGKTVIAALDYRRLCKQLGGRPRLLFVAHRQEILQQALATYRQVLRDPSFGELLFGGAETHDRQHLFATIQSVLSRDLIHADGPEYWHVVVIDECHHIAAESFRSFVRQIQPAFLLGLTATPERGDGESILPYFDTRPDGSPAAELRLWDALDQQLLSPFEYYGIADPTDFTQVSWGKASQEREDLNVILLADKQRARLISNAVEKYVDQMSAMRALGFCVSVDHARMMAEHFSAQGVPSAVVHGDTPRDIRNAVRRQLESGEIQAIFSCDLYNEGIDLPFVNTILLLRPTDSPVVFTQQLGRGLRLWPGKTSCLVLDFVGQVGTSFRFDKLWRSISGMSRREFTSAVERDFPILPPGCIVQFDRKARETVLANLREATTQRWRQLVNELRAYHHVQRGGYSVSDFLRDQHIDLTDLYRASTPSGWTKLRVDAGLCSAQLGEQGTTISKRLHALLHHNDPAFLRFLSTRDLTGPSFAADSDRRRALMLGYQLFSQGDVSVESLARALKGNPELAMEIASLAEILLDFSDISSTSLAGAPNDWTVAQFGRYSRAEILAAIGFHTDGHRAVSREGVLRMAEQKVELLFVTLDKSEGFHQDISYRDYAISPSEFHWETQNAVGPDTRIGKQYIDSPGNGWRYFLFVRQTPEHPFCALGEVVQSSITGSKPMAIVWRLSAAMPISLFKELSVLRA